MVLSFTLPDGTRAGIRPTRELGDLTVEALRLQCLPPANEAPVVFFVSDQAALTRVIERFGLRQC